MCLRLRRIHFVQSDENNNFNLQLKIHMDYVLCIHVLQQDIPMHAFFIILRCIVVQATLLYAKVTYCAYENYKPLLCKFVHVLAVPVTCYKYNIFWHSVHRGISLSLSLSLSTTSTSDNNNMITKDFNLYTLIQMAL